MKKLPVGIRGKDNLDELVKSRFLAVFMAITH